MLHDKLRQPDFKRHRSNRSLDLLLGKNAIDICRPFAPWSVPNAPEWNEDPYHDDTWGLYYHSLGWLIVLDFGVDHAADAATRDECAVRLRKLALSYVRHLATAADSNLHKMTWFDHATAWRASTLAYLYERRFKDTLSPQELAEFQSVVRQHVQVLLGFIDSGRWKANNHGIFHAEALWDIAQVFGDVIDSEAIKARALAAMRSVFEQMIDFGEGVCREHSIYYHLFDAWLLAESAEYMSRFDVDVIPGYREVLRDMVEFYARVAPGNRNLPAIGDTTYGRTPASPMLDQIRQLIAPTPVTLYLLGDTKAVADKPARLSIYPRTGFYLFHDDPDGNPAAANCAVLLDKPYMGAHAHSDGGSFTIDLGGQPIVIDSGGPYAYGNKLRFGYFKAAEAHNVVIVDGKSLPYLTQVTNHASSDTFAAVRLSCQDLDGAAWQRAFVDLGDATYLIVDSVSCDRPRRYDALLHLAPEFSLSGGNGRVVAESSGKPGALVLQTANRTMDTELLSGDGDKAFPRSLITRDLGHRESSPLIRSGFKAANGWLATLISRNPSLNLEVHQYFGGKLLRAIVECAGTSRSVEIDLSDVGRAVRVLPVRLFRTGGADDSSSTSDK